MSTVTVVSNWSFRSFRNRLNQQEYTPHSPQYPHQASGKLPNASSYGYLGHQEKTLVPTSSTDDKQEASLLLEHPRKMNYMAQQSRERENQLRSPSPVKRGRRLL